MNRFFVLLVLAACHKEGDAPAAGGPGGGTGGARPVPVVVATVKKQDVPVVLSGLGTVTANKTVTVHPRVDGMLEQVLFKEGQEVKQGQTLALIDARPYQIAVDQAEAALARDSATQKSSALTRDRYKQVRDQNLIAQSQLDDQESIVAQNTAAVRSDAATLDNAKLNLQWTRLTSPIDGFTGVRLIDAGNLVHSNDTTGIVVLTQLDPIAVLFTLPQDDLPRLSEQIDTKKEIVVARDEPRR